MPNIVSILRDRAVSLPDQCAYLFLEDGIHETAKINYAELDYQARKVANYLREKNKVGERVLLLYPTGLDFIINFMGCLYAGIIAVPVSCPKITEFAKAKTTLQSLAQHADIRGILTTSIYVDETKKIVDQDIFITDTTHLVIEPATNQQLPSIDNDTIAYFQYTSGSTATPNAAIVRHKNLNHSLTSMIKVWNYNKNSITLNWAPHTHIYGLACGLLIPLYHGTLAILLPPAVFIQRPVLWLEAITRYHVTHSGCPNFGYHLCIRDIADTELQQINLQSWKVAINGGEKVQYETLKQFSKKFATYGFKPKQFNSAYGMSEVAGAIAVSQYQKEPRCFQLNSEALKNNEVKFVKETDNSRHYVSSGRMLPGLQAIIVDPVTLTPAAKNQIGEVWLAGESVVSGYWRGDEEAHAIFQGKVPGKSQTYFRTGDLGFLYQNELCLMGRLKDVLVIHGKKYSPLDLELTIATALQKLEINNISLLFAVEIASEEKVIVAQEIKTQLESAKQNDIVNNIQHVLMQQHGINPHQIILVAENSIPRTTSGKLQRKRCQQQYLANGFSILNQPPKQSLTDTENFINIVASVLTIEPAQIHLSAPLSQYQFDSINIIKLTGLLNEHYGITLSPAILFEYTTLGKFYDDFIGKQVKTATKTIEQETHAQDIAIIGMSGIFPGAPDLDTFWDNLINHKDTISEIPEDRWRWQDYDGDPQTEKNKTQIKWGGFISDMQKFDAEFFAMSPHEAELTDPQQRHFLQVTWKAIEDAGYAVADLSQVKTGLFVGVFNNDYAELLQQQDIIDAYNTTATTHSILANRVSYLLNFQGPSEAINTACSSSLVAIHHAVRAIQNGDCDVAIAGGVNALLTPTSYISANKANMLAIDGRCKTFDKKANGFVRGEGVAAIVLKPLQQARKDHDHIYGIIKGTAINHGGHVSSLTVPNPNAQADVIIAACQRAMIPVDNIQYIEAHGTGTALGDPIEINGLKKAFTTLATQQTTTLTKNSCAIGSVKTHIGHLESAAGIASVIKVLLAMHHQQLPANLHFDELNPYIDIQDSPFYILQKNMPWPINNKPRCAGISSFGFGGANAHIVVEEFINQRNVNSTVALTSYLIALSAKNELSLQQYIKNLHDWIDKQQYKIPSLLDLSYTLNAGRTHFAKRCAIVANSIDELQCQLVQLIQGTQPSLLSQSESLQQLAEAYLRGEDIDWQVIYKDQPVQRISLPTYAFAKNHYWLPIANKPSKAEHIAEKLHPLLDANISTLHSQTFVKTFQADDFYVKDHIVDNTAIVPGAAIIEMARVAAVLANPEQTVIAIQDMIWEKAIGITQQTQTIKINLYPQQRDIKFEIINQEDICAHGSIIYGEPNNATENIDLTAIQQRCINKWTSQDVYLNFKNHGLHYGPSFRVINQLANNTVECLAKIILPPHLKNDVDRFVLHPALVDGALQAVFALLKNKDAYYLPYRIDHIDIFQALPSVCYAYCTVITENDDFSMPQFLIKIVDENGKVIAQFNRFTLFERELMTTKNLHYYAEWQQSDPTSIPYSLSESLFVIDNQEIAQTLQKHYPEETIISLNTTQHKPEHYAYIFPATIILSINAAENELDSANTIYQLLSLTQAIIQQKPKQTTRIIVVSRSHSPFIAALAGFAKTLQIEFPQIHCQIAMMNHATNIIDVLKRNDLILRYDHDNYSWVKKYQPVKNNELSPVFKKQNVYLITGGAGGLGLIIARFLATEYQAKLVLVGRSVLSEQQLSIINELNSCGAEVVYQQADITQRNSAAQLIKTIKKQFGQLQGVIHAAGVVKDNYIIKKSAQEVAQVLAPKVSGTLYLDEATQAENLDFFLLFSSVASVFGNTGQSDYSFANAFLDAFAEQREGWRKQNKRTGKTISINWPLWAEGGMSVDEEAIKALRQHLGIEPLAIQHGLTALQHILSLDYTQQIIVSGQHKKLNNALNQATLLTSQSTATSPTTLTVNKVELKEKTIAYLKNILSSVSKTPAEKIHLHDAFENYGIDSVMIIKLNQRLSETFTDLPKTLFFEYQHLDALADYFIEAHSAILTTLRQVISSHNNDQQFPLKLRKQIDRERREANARDGVFGASSQSVSSALQRELLNNDIAIIGIDGQYPQADNLDIFWENLKTGKDCISEIPNTRWQHDIYFDSDKDKPGKSYSKWGGFLNDVDKFDPLFFNISPREAELMDPQERLFLQTAWRTIEDAGYAREQLATKKVGVFVGVMYGQYQLFGAEELARGRLVETHSVYASIANRVSYFFDFHGPSIALDTMCSSSLTSLHLACQSIYRGESELAIAGGVNLSIHPNKYLLLSHGKYLSTDGHCKSFGEGGDGYVPGEGVGAVLLKPLAQALEDGDHIYAIIKGSSINHGGKTNGYTVPNPSAQAAVMEQAYKNAGIDPKTVNYLETHGTGTALGDPIEIAGLAKIFHHADHTFSYPIGSVKSNIGHCESAAGIAALTKVILQMTHNQLVPSLHAELPNQNINWDKTPFTIQQTLADWNDTVKIAGISSFGAGGSNAHVILQQAPLQSYDTHTKIKTDYLFTLSAKTELALRQQLVNLETWLTKNRTVSLENISYTLNTGRSHFEKRCAIVANSMDELQQTLQQLNQQFATTNAFINVDNNIINRNQSAVKNSLKKLIDEALSLSYTSATDYRENLLSIAQFYTDGYDFEWQTLHQDENKKKISLPTYPFAKERCWWSSDNLVSLAGAVESILIAQCTSTALVSVTDEILHKVSMLLKIKKEDINIHKNLSEYGMDSVNFVNLANQINQHYQVNMTPAAFYAHNSIQHIADYLQKEFHDTVTQPVANSFTPAAATNQDIAIIGMQGLFPQSKDIHQFWENLLAGKDLITEAPIERWDWHDKLAAKWGGFIPDFDKFDAEFFNISTREANLMDPQQRLFLEIAWKTFEDAGYDPVSFAGQKVGVFAGVEFSEYQTLIAKENKEFHGFIATGNSHSMIANRVSYFFNFHGPSETIDTACSSSLVAIHRAIQAIHNGECTTALAGGVSLLLNPDTFTITHQLGALSDDGRCKTFDKSANGYVKGEGVATILLKSLSQALTDGDFIYGVIKGSAVNHGGKAQSLTAPNSLAQAAVLTEAYAQAGIDPTTITYIETHGTGTSLGDPVEIEGLKQVFKKSSYPYCGLGSVKTNIGHLEPASGIASVIKVLLSMQHEMIPANLHFQDMNPYINLQDTPFYLLTQPQSWQKKATTLLRAGVSSFGFGGTNAHVIIEQAPAQSTSINHIKPYYLITLSAKTEKALQQKIQDLSTWLIANNNIDLYAVSYTLNTGRTHFDVRRAWVVASVDELLFTLQNNALPPQQSLTDDGQYYRKELLAAAALYLQKQPIQWNTLYQEKIHRLAGLPAYPFNKQRYWHNTVFSQTISEPITIDKNTSLTDFTLKYLQKIFAEILQIASDTIAYDETYEVYGVDSVLGLEITERLEKDFGTLPKTILYERNQLQDLAKHLQQKYMPALMMLKDEKQVSISAEVLEKQIDCSLQTAIPGLLTTASYRSPVALCQSAIPASAEFGTVSDNIAIIGLSGIFPMANNMEEFWQNLVTGRDCIQEIPQERWNYKDYPITIAGQEKYYRYGGFINDIDKFDPLFFNVAPRDAALMDPQERLFMQSTWTTLENAGYTRQKLKTTTNNQVGVFAGVTYNYYPMHIADEWHKNNRVPLDIQTFSIANRVSYFLNLRGPSFVIDTACSSALAAIHLACESILRGESVMAIAGGVNLSLHPSKYHFLASFNFMSEQGRCTSFADGGTGYVPSEGVGSVLLKPLSTAIKDNDRIYAVIKGSSMNHGGKTSGYTVPNPNAQADLIKQALKKSNINPRTISYIEAHGTGTALGDPIEVRGLQDAFEEYTLDKQFCALGSVKSNIGHLESAAGVSQLAKVLLQMQHKKLVPSIHAEKLNPFIDFAESPFYVQRKLADWITDNQQPRRAGISSFGAGGTNVHLIVEEFVPTIARQQSPQPEKHLFILSAMNAERLQEYAQSFYDFIERNLEQDKQWLHNVCYTLQTGRERMASRLAIIVATIEELQQHVAAYLQNPQQTNNVIWVNHNNEKIEWEKEYAATSGSLIDLPTYPFAKRRCWIQTVETKATPIVNNEVKTLQPTESIHEWLYTTTWEEQANTTQPIENTNKKWLIFSDITLGLLLQESLGKENSIYCFAGEKFEIYHPSVYYINPQQAEDYQQLFTEIHAKYNNELHGVIYLSTFDISDNSHQLLHLFQKIIQKQWQYKLQFCFVTRGSQPVLAKETIDMSQHYLWSMARIFAAEQSDYHVCLLDLDSTIALRKDAEHIASEALSTHQKASHIAYRKQQRYTIRLNTYQAPEETPHWQAPETAIITGGLGALGIEVAKFLAAAGTQYLLLTGSTLLPPRAEWKTIQEVTIREKINALLALESLKVQVKYIAVDVVDKIAMKKVIDDTEQEWEKSIKGVFHLAGVTTDNVPIANMNKDILDSVLSVKMRGAINLHELFNQSHIESFVLFGSIAAVPYFGMSGLSAYAMANEFLNGLALHRRRQGLSGISINWVAWAEKGMSFRYNHGAFLDAVGMSSLAITHGIDILQSILAYNPETIIICKINWDKFLRINAESRKLDFFTHYHPAINETQKIIIDPTKITEIVIQAITNALELTADEIDPTTPFQNYGMDSIIGINFTTQLDQYFPGIVSPMDLYRYPTLSKLIEYIQQSCQPVAEAETKIIEKISFSEEQYLDDIKHLDASQLNALIEKELQELEIDDE